MSKIGDLFTREPALTMGLVQTALALIVSFGLGLTAVQIGAILGFTAAILSIVVRQRVSPVPPNYEDFEEV